MLFQKFTMKSKSLLLTPSFVLLLLMPRGNNNEEATYGKGSARGAHHESALFSVSGK